MGRGGTADLCVGGDILSRGGVKVVDAPYAWCRANFQFALAALSVPDR